MPPPTTRSLPHVEAAPLCLDVIVADDHPAYRVGLTRTLQAAGLRVVGVSVDGRAALALARRLAPAVAVVDLRMPDVSGADVARTLRAEGSAVRVIVVSVYDEDELVAEVLEAGAAAFVSKAAPTRELVAAIAACAPVPAGPTGPATCHAAG